MRKAEIFIAAPSGSRFTFAHASWTRESAGLDRRHAGALEAIDGEPELIAPDYTKAAIVRTRSCRPQVNDAHTEMAAHYGTAILPARPGEHPNP